MTTATEEQTLASAQLQVQRFHGKFDFAIGLLKRLQASKRGIVETDLATQLDFIQKRREWDNVGLQRAELIMEELTETMRAWRNADPIELADGLADLLYVVLGTAVAAGINIAPIFAEVHESNMSKDVGTGFKPTKGKDFHAPELRPLLATQGFGP